MATYSTCTTCYCSPCVCGTSSYIVTPSTGFCPGTTTTDNPLLTLTGATDMTTLLSTVANGKTFRLKAPAIWPDGCVVTAIRVTDDGDNEAGYLPLNIVQGTYAGTQTEVYTSGAAITNVEDPINQSGSIDLEGLGIQPICGTRAFTMSIVPTAAIGTIQLNGVVVWTSSAVSSTTVTTTIDVSSTLITYQVNITDGTANINYEGDVI